MRFLLYHENKPCAIVESTNRRAAEAGRGELLYGSPRFPCRAEGKRTSPAEHWERIQDAHLAALENEIRDLFKLGRVIL
jgi:hypothetical protein